MALAAGLGVVTQAAEAGTWSVPEPLAQPTTPRDSFGSHALAFTPRGSAAALWGTSARTERSLVLNTGTIARTRTSGSPSFGGEQPLLGSVNHRMTGFALDRRSRAVLLVDLYDRDSEGDTRTGVSAYRGRIGTDGTLSIRKRPQLLTSRPALSQLRGNAAGDAVAVWRYGVDDSSQGALRATTSAKGSAFARPSAITNARIQVMDSAINDQGQSVVVWQQGARLYARTAARGHRFGRRLTVGRVTASNGETSFPSVDIGSDGDIVVAWTRETAMGRSVVAARARAGHGFGGERVLDTFTGATEATVPRAAAGPGTVFVAWNSADAVKLASVDRNQTSTQTLASARAFRPELAALPDGGAVTAWTSSTSAAPGSFAVARTADGAAGPVETIGGSDAVLRRLAINPITRQPAAIVTTENDGGIAFSRRTP